MLSDAEDVMGSNLERLVIVAALVTLTACIDVQSEVDQRKDVTTGAVSNRLPPDGVLDHDLSTSDGAADVPWTDRRGDGLADLSGDVPDLMDDTQALDQAEEVDLVQVDACQPSCDGLECGPDMCGGLCGFCPGEKVCTLGQCKTCKPACTGLECGGDGCGGLCGVCPTKFTCFAGQCTPPSCVDQQLVYGEFFDSCSQGDFGIFDGQPDDDVTWWGVPMNFKSAPCALYLGNPLTMSYETGSSVKVELLSTLVGLPGGQALQLTFEILMLTEILPSPLYPYNHDVLFLAFEQEGGGTHEIWSSKSLLNDTQGQWVPVAVDMSDFAGVAGRFRFLFDTLDSTDNDNPGIFLDDFRVASICPYCKVDEDCLDKDACTLDSCLHFSNQPSIGTCYHAVQVPCEPPEDPDEGR
jgi:hypothetical protein